jgi:hypothetical protein
MASIQIEREVVACTSATHIGFAVNEVISHDAPTSCIQVPILDTNEAVHSILKMGFCSAGHASNLGILFRPCMIYCKFRGYLFLGRYLATGKING